jgi:hypothetical protein
MVRHQFRRRNDECDAFNRVRSCGTLQDRILAEARSNSSVHSRSPGSINELQRYRKSGDWTFASGCRHGRKPYWGQAILRKYIRPKAQELGIEKKFGWHTFRHRYSTPLRSVGAEFKVMQEPLRHSSLRSTLDVYTHAITPAKQAAQAAVMSLCFLSPSGIAIARVVLDFEETSNLNVGQ